MPTEPPPHPTCGEHDGKVMGLDSFSFFFSTGFPFLFFLLEFVKVVTTVDVDVTVAAVVAVVGFGVFKERWFFFGFLEKKNTG